MGIQRSLAVALLCTLLLGPLDPLVAAQYAEGLPPGVVAAAVDGQPIDAANAPRTDKSSPQISGRINTGLPSVDLAIADGEVVRFAAEVDERGRFRARPPEPLEPGEYSLYIFDALVGTFVVEATAGAERDARGQGGANRGGVPDLDIARVVPFPFDFGEAIPELGLLDGRFFTLDDEALRSATAAGDASADAVEQTRADLRDSGWQGRYESRLAVPLPEDPSRFSLQVSSFAILYADAESAAAAFAASTGAADAIPGETIGEESEIVPLTGTTPDTEVEFQALRLIYRVDRILGMIILADLGGGEVDQALLEAAASSVVDRANQVLAGEAPVLAPRTLRLDLSRATPTAIEEAYEVVDGLLVDLYDEDAAVQAARVAAYSGSFDAYAGSVTALVPEGGDDGIPVAFGATLISLPSAEDADRWLSELPDRLGEDPLRGYLSFAAVEDAPVFGEASATYAFQRQVGDEVVAGFRVYLRVGSEIAAIEYASAADVSLADIEPLVAAQIACLEAAVCPEVAPIPRTAAGRATPTPDGPGEAGAVRRDRRGDATAEAEADGGVGEAPGEEDPAPAPEPAGGGVVDVVPTEEPATEEPPAEDEGGVRDVGA